jgi:hypothetical protein
MKWVKRSIFLNLTKNRLVIKFAPTKAGTVRIKLQCDAFVKLLLQWKINSIALGIQHAVCMRHIVICGLPSSTKFFPHYLINGTIFEKNY